MAGILDVRFDFQLGRSADDNVLYLASSVETKVAIVLVANLLRFIVEAGEHNSMQIVEARIVSTGVDVVANCVQVLANNKH